MTLTDSDQNLPATTDSGLVATLMPNQARTYGMRLVGWFLVIWGLIIGIHVANVIGFDLYTRTHWRRVDGDMLRFEEKSFRVSSSSRPSYWIEFEVEFDPKDAGCNTGMSWGNENGKKKTITRMQAMVKRIVASALQGDLKALMTLFEILRRTGKFADAGVEPLLPDNYQGVLDSYITRRQKAGSTKLTKSSET